MQEPLINGIAYSWSQLAVRMSNGTVPFAGITKIDYEDEEEQEFNYGAGKMPVSFGDGNYKATASITLPVEEVLKMQRSVPSRRLQDVPFFDFTVSYLHPDTTRIHTDVLRNCRFPKNIRNLSQNDKTFPVELPMMVSHIDWDESNILGLDSQNL